MSRLTSVFLLLCVSACVSAVLGGAAHIKSKPPKRVQDMWEPLPVARQDTTGLLHDKAWTPIHLYFEHAAGGGPREEASVRDCDHLSTLQARLDCAVKIRGPTNRDLQRMYDAGWLRPLLQFAVTHDDWQSPTTTDPRCFQSWDALHCRFLPVAMVMDLFGLTKHPRLYRKAKVRNSGAYVFSVEDLTLPVGVSHVSGVHAFDHRELTARPHSRELSSAEARALFGSAAARGKGGDDDDRHSQSHQEAESNGMIPIDNFDFPSVDGNAPLVLGSSYWGRTVTAVFRCGDGLPTVFAAGKPSCPQSAAKDRIKTIAVTTRSDTFEGVLETTETYSLANWTCTVGSEHVTANASDAVKATAVCVGPLPLVPDKRASYNDWARINISVTVAFEQGNATAAWLTPYYSSTVYVEGVVDPATNATLRRVPEAALTGIAGSTLVTPQQIRTQYRIPSNLEAPDSVQGVVQFTPEESLGTSRLGFDLNDIKQFLNDTAKLPIIAADPPLHIIGNASRAIRSEATLDLELMMAIAPNASTYMLVLVDGPTQAFASYADAFIYFVGTVMTNQNGVLDTYGVSQVWSISYGGTEWSENIDKYYHLHSLLHTVTGNGVAITASSGDSGSFFQWKDDEGEAYYYDTAEFPGLSPYIVALGATSYLPRKRNGSDAFVEDACSSLKDNRITTGGGFSTYFDLPDFQRPVLEKAGFGNATKVGTPDLSIIGAWISIISRGGLSAVFGTSASAPIFGAMVSLMAQMRRGDATRSGSKDGSFRRLPEFVYSLSERANETLVDITVGDNCVGAHEAYYSAGFPVYARAGGRGQYATCWQADHGWDPVTGQGVPMFDAMTQLALNYNPPRSQSGDATKESHTTVIIVGAAAGVGAVVVLGVVVGCVVLRRRRKARRGLSGAEIDMPETPSSKTYSAIP